MKAFEARRIRMQLIHRQAKVRDGQRLIMDEIHGLLHEHQRNESRKTLGTLIPDSVQNGIIDRIHEKTHQFMRGMDFAILIHEKMAILDGLNPQVVTRALWPVRTLGKG